MSLMLLRASLRPTLASQALRRLRCTAAASDDAATYAELKQRMWDGAIRVAEVKASFEQSKRGPVWPRGLLGGSSSGDGPTTVPPQLAAELLYEVGWAARHCFLDVRPTENVSSGKVRGALSVPAEPAASFVERATAILEQQQRDQPAVAHVEGSTHLALDATDPTKQVRVIVGFGDEARAAAATLLRAGFINTVHCGGKFEEWERNDLPCDLPDDCESIPDSTF
tara:strand:- start:247 stop:921 length:675 start_codon:yes stop_codon:yes gene_type:complete